LLLIVHTRWVVDWHLSPLASSIWNKDWDDKDDKTKDEEFEDYFADLLQWSSGPILILI
jgi:hypothetical protein